MQYEVKESGYGVTVTSAKFDVVITPEAPLNVAIGESAKMEVPQAINYIKSGEAEIKAAADIGVSRISSTVTDGLNQYNANAMAKTTTYNDNATSKLNAYNLNAQNLTTAFNNNASDKTIAFNNNATSKIGDFNTNATNKTNAFNQNATDKTDAFNLNATNKTTAFNDNAAIKQAAVDASANAAAASAASAKQWAIGDPSEPTGNSAKYWANQAAGSLSGLESRVTTIEGDIPAQASSSNQLADKNFVNSSIATNTANFIGTFNSVAELEAYSGQKDDNDYAFVISTDAAGNTLYNRYKWNGTAWLFEYALNNSSFTSNQWAAINSGATTANIGQIATNTAAIATKANDNAVVHLAGAETITGLKSFSKNSGYAASVKQSISQLSKGTVPANTYYFSLIHDDGTPNPEGQDYNNKNRFGLFETSVETDGTVRSCIQCYKNEAGVETNARLGIAYPSTGDPYTFAPTPSAGDNSTKIATTAFVQNMLNTLYPVGSIYIGTQASCPLATLISGSTWVLVSEGRVLQGADSGHAAGTTIEAGLPNITGTASQDNNSSGFANTFSGVFYNGGDTTHFATTGEGNYSKVLGFDASRSNSIYGNSNTVQPPAYVVNIWRRTA